MKIILLTDLTTILDALRISSHDYSRHLSGQIIDDLVTAPDSVFAAKVAALPGQSPQAALDLVATWEERVKASKVKRDPTSPSGTGLSLAQQQQSHLSNLSSAMVSITETLTPEGAVVKFQGINSQLINMDINVNDRIALWSREPHRLEMLIKRGSGGHRYNEDMSCLLPAGTSAWELLAQGADRLIPGYSLMTAAETNLAPGILAARHFDPNQEIPMSIKPNLVWVVSEAVHVNATNYDAAAMWLYGRPHYKIIVDKPGVFPGAPYAFGRVDPEGKFYHVRSATKNWAEKQSQVKVILGQKPEMTTEGRAALLRFILANNKCDGANQRLNLEAHTGAISHNMNVEALHKEPKKSITSIARFEE